jgi:hypothetical protein
MSVVGDFLDSEHSLSTGASRSAAMNGDSKTREEKTRKKGEPIPL